MLDFIRLPVGLLQANAYIVYDKQGSCLIIDPGDEAKKIHQFIRKKKLQPQAILLTHAHFDHIGAVELCRDKYRIPVYLHEQEKKWLSNPHKNGSAQYEGAEPVVVEQADHLFSVEERVTVGAFSFDVLPTPGHSPGSVSFFFEESAFVIVGDTLFKKGMGRTDLPGGQEHQLIRSIREKLYTLPKDTYVLPGHDDVTTIGQELDDNPHVNGKT